MLRKALLTCGILSSLLYLAMLVYVPLQWASYHSSSQTIHELAALGAPTRPLWIALSSAHGVLLAAFSAGLWLSAGTSAALPGTGWLLLLNVLLAAAWPPTHLRPVLAAGQGTIADTLHIVFTLAWALVAMAAMGSAAVAFGRRFRVYTLATMALLALFGALTGAYGARMSADLPTPLVGVWERIDVGVFIAWIAALATVLLRQPADLDTMSIFPPRPRGRAVAGGRPPVARG
jgi:Protein of unknown function (DUF998)